MHDLDSAIECAEGVCREGDADEIMVIGGAEIYALALPRADRLYCTLVHTKMAGDTYFPEFDESRWQEKAREEHYRDDTHAFDFTIRILEPAPDAQTGE